MDRTEIKFLFIRLAPGQFRSHGPTYFYWDDVCQTCMIKRCTFTSRTVINTLAKNLTLSFITISDKPYLRQLKFAFLKWYLVSSSSITLTGDSYVITNSFICFLLCVYTDYCHENSRHTKMARWLSQKIIVFLTVLFFLLDYDFLLVLLVPELLWILRPLHI